LLKPAFSGQGPVLIECDEGLHLFLLLPHHLGLLSAFY